MTVKSSPIIDPAIRDELEYALRDDVGRGIGTHASQTPHEVSDGIEFEVGADGGVFVGTVPSTKEAPLDLEYSDRNRPADGFLYVYIADLETYKERTNGDVTATYAALHYESEFFRALAEELTAILTRVFETDDIRFERYPSDESGEYYVLPLPP